MIARLRRLWQRHTRQAARIATLERQLTAAQDEALFWMDRVIAAAVRSPVRVLGCAPPPWIGLAGTDHATPPPAAPALTGPGWASLYDAPDEGGVGAR